MKKIYLVLIVNEKIKIINFFIIKYYYKMYLIINININEAYINLNENLSCINI